MLHGIGFRAACRQIMAEGVTSLYRGMLPPLLQKSISSSLMFGTYDMFRRCSLLEACSDHPKVRNAIAASLSGSVEAILAPFERIQTLLQDQAYHDEFTNMKHAVQEVGLRFGFREYYRGLTPILLRNGPSNVIFFLLREELGDVGQQYTASTWTLNGLRQFLVGASIGALNSTLFYPCNVIKVHMQSKLGGSFLSMWTAAREIYLDRGRKISMFYKGVHVNYTRSFVSWGVINLAYERLKIVLFTDDSSV